MNEPVSNPEQLPLPDETLLRFYGVSDYSALVTAMEDHILQLIDTHKRNVKPWEDTFPPTLLPKWEREQRASVVPEGWQLVPVEPTDAMIRIGAIITNHVTRAV